jgi:hypothetical protein
MREYSGYPGLLTKTKENISIKFLANLVKMFPIGYQQAYDNAYKKSNVGPYQARDLWPHMRRAVIDSKLQNLINLYDGMACYTDKNVAKNCSNVKIKTNDIILTANAVKYPTQIVKHAIFRETSATDNRQLELFPKEESKNINGLFEEEENNI